MEAKELRIGNWVCPTNENANYPYIITSKEIVLAEADKERFNPIPLTPEILEKAGFTHKYKSCGDSFYKDGITLTNQDEDDEGNAIENFVFYVCYNYGRNIYFLHDLQNLIFALTGQELEIAL